MKTTHDFKGKWITDKDFATLEPINVFHRQLDTTPFKESTYTNCHILFRKTFNIAQKTKATIYISADDYYKLYVNGKFVVQGPSPSYVANYNYNEIEVELEKGENTIAVHTYYQGLINRVWVSGDDMHGLILDLAVDGETVVSSDESFKTARHSAYTSDRIIGYKTQFMETYNANSTEVGFEKVGFNDSTWENASIKEYADYKLSKQMTYDLVFEDIKPIELRKTDFGYFVDFGKNYVGSLALTAKGNKDDKITMLCGQEFNDDGRVRYILRANCHYEEYMILSGNTDILNQYDYKAFRYAELVLPENCIVDEDSIILKARHYPFTLDCKINTDDEDLNRVWDLCVHTLKYGVQETIQDCPDREKGFYLGDGCYTALTLAVLTNDWTMVRKLINDSLNSKFITPSLMTCADCSFIQEIAEFPLIMMILIAIYTKVADDKEFIKERYDDILNLMETYKSEYETETGMLANIDKWCVVEWPQNFRDGYDVDLTQGQICKETHSVVNAYYVTACKCMNSIAKAMDKPMFIDTDKLEKQYLDAFFDKENNVFFDSTTSKHTSFPSIMFSYGFGLCPNKESEDIALKMLFDRGITAANLFVSFPILFKLRMDGKLDILKRELLRKDAWLNILAEGFTSSIESWSRDSKWNTSLFHLTLSFAALFLTDEFWDKLK